MTEKLTTEKLSELKLMMVGRALVPSAIPRKVARCIPSLIAAAEREAKMREALQSIAEYWNGGLGEAAFDAASVMRERAYDALNEGGES